MEENIKEIKKVCACCKMEKTSNEFYKSKSGKTGLSCYCKICTNENGKFHYYKDIKETRRRNRAYFEKNKEKTRARRLATQKRYELNNKEKCAQIRKRYQEKHKEKLSAKAKIFREKNRAMLSAKNKEYNRKKNQEKLNNFILAITKYPDILKILIDNHNYIRIKEKLRRNTRSRIKNGLRSASVTKSESTYSLLGCSFQFYRQYLESLFCPGMTWDNYGYGPGKWEIDHIKPICKFNMTELEEQTKAFNYLNTQPLWYEDHQIKTVKDFKDSAYYSVTF